jgi:signal transduction histidine kinase
MKSEFVSTAAHELRTPMASIFGFAELMMHKMLPPEKQHRALAAIHRQTKLMIAIVNELLDLARIESRRGKDFVLETVELGEVTRQLLQDFSPPADRAAPELAETLTGALVRVDRNKLRQAAGNVLSNAYKYSPQGGAVQLRIVQQGAATGTLAGGARVGIEVRDQGIGMTPEQLARVGERFYRADGSGKIPGTGLGMSIVREILSLLGGELAITSTPGAGTCVTLWLPRAAAQQHAADKQATDLTA